MVSSKDPVYWQDQRERKEGRGGGRGNIEFGRGADTSWRALGPADQAPGRLGESGCM